jgi:hypothetical protein
MSNWSSNIIIWKATVMKRIGFQGKLMRWRNMIIITFKCNNSISFRICGILHQLEMKEYGQFTLDLKRKWTI